ncbi:MAG: dTDP-4-dehydrorhamnose 3,5-epimerase [Nitrospira sp.]|nr:dTDP-4-dehydrorhamnose 3,5-epimerase [Candidatus Manganitrophaceae bacterium]HIL34698.1 dTDP-4-dehydrorhamnose 3,5-epimerase [Candidatus Manganitrophaceae bacterium]
MKRIETKLPGVIILEPTIFRDPRGFFLETWHQDRYKAAGLPDFVQDNLSFSTQGVLRGLHFQNPDPQGKLVTVLQGEVFDVAVDIRVGSPTFGQWVGVTLSGENARQIYIPEGFAHGFCITSPTALFSYKCTAFYKSRSEQCLLWNDPDIGITWPIETPILSEKDSAAPSLEKIDHGGLPRFSRGS